MEIEIKKIRYCKSIGCENLDGHECKLDECSKTDRASALKERRAEIKKAREVTHD